MSSNFGGEKAVVTEDAPSGRKRNGGGVQAPPPMRSRLPGASLVTTTSPSALLGGVVHGFDDSGDVTLAGEHVHDGDVEGVADVLAVDRVEHQVE